MNSLYSYWLFSLLPICRPHGRLMAIFIYTVARLREPEVGAYGAKVGGYGGRNQLRKLALQSFDNRAVVRHFG